MEAKVLTNLQWPLVLERLMVHAQTEAGRHACLGLATDLDAAGINSSWGQQEPLRDLIRSGYKPQIGDLPQMEEIFRGASLGQVLDGEALRAIFHLLATVKQVHRFTTDFQDRCPPLVRYHKGIYPLPKLSQAIEKAISPEGEVLDDASGELKRVRQQKIGLRKKIEQQIRQLLADQELETYLQDKFFTVRADRYVVPIRLDGRGRIKGSIYDTSDSGQTLYIEPTSIAPMNEGLLELELSEKLEILRIFRELSAMVAEEYEILRGNYERLIEFDILTAKASLAVQLDAVAVELSDAPVLDLRAARHPLLFGNGGAPPVPNDIVLGDGQFALIVSGPNAGGKTVVLKTVGILHVMAKAGLLIPADRTSRMHLFREVRVEIGDAQSLTANLSTFSGHLLGLKPILERATEHDLVLLDELAVGTEPQTGSALAQAVLEDIVRRKIIAIVTTHYDTLKGLAQTDQRFRNGSMEFSTRNLKPTYNLILDVPGQSYGIEVAEQLGVPPHVIHRAKELRGTTAVALDQLVKSLQMAREEAGREKDAAHMSRLKLEQEKAHWEKERRALEESRGRAAEKLKDRFDDEFDTLKTEYQSVVEQLKKMMKTVKAGETVDLTEISDELARAKQTTGVVTDQYATVASHLKSEFRPAKDIPGEPAKFADLRVGSRVYVLSLDKEALVTKIQDGPTPIIEVQAGLVRIRPPLQELRIITSALQETRPPTKAKKAVPATGSAPGNKSTPGFVIVTPTNSVDVRGQDAEHALEKAWQFIDRAVMRGESQLIIIHGHGSDKLKKTIRIALAQQSPYKLNFRPGEAEEGGDGVTVIRLEP